MDLLREENRVYTVEHSQVVLLNTRRCFIGMQNISQGTLDTLLVHPREVFRRTIAVGAAAIVIAHNHPSGDPTPSEQDIKVTRDLKNKVRAGRIPAIRLNQRVLRFHPRTMLLTLGVPREAAGMTRNQEPLRHPPNHGSA